MIVRIFFIAFGSLLSGVCYLSGMTRLMSALLTGFGAAVALFFGILFLFPPRADSLWLPIYEGEASSWPFFVLAVCLCLIIVWMFFARPQPAPAAMLSGKHLKYLAGGLFAYLCSLFIPALLWFPSEEKLASAPISALETEVLLGVCLYLLGSGFSLFLLYRASKGTAGGRPDLMRRFVLALFSVFHLDKMPALVAYLLIYSPETHMVFPKTAALALAAYIPVSLFLALLSRECHVNPDDS